MSDDFLEENSKTEARERGRRNTSYAIVGIIAAVAIIGWLTNFYFASMYDWGDRSKGEFGDIFGVINSLFTGLAFIGVVWSVYNQQEELRETKRQTKIAKLDLKRTQDILAKQEENIGAQNAATNKQMFEVTFFQLFTSFNQLTNSLNAEEPRGSYTHPINKSKVLYEKAAGTGKEAITVILKAVEMADNIHMLNIIGGKLEGSQDSEERKSIYDKTYYDGHPKLFNTIYERVLERHGDETGRYFRSLYTIFRFIEQANLNQNDKYFYFKFIRAQLSTDESTLLAINMISDRTSEEFNWLITKYGMAKNALHARTALLRRYHSYIPHGAYGKRYVERQNLLGKHPTTNMIFQSVNADAAEAHAKKQKNSNGLGITRDPA